MLAFLLQGRQGGTVLIVQPTKAIIYDQMNYLSEMNVLGVDGEHPFEKDPLNKAKLVNGEFTHVIVTIEALAGESNGLVNALVELHKNGKGLGAIIVDEVLIFLSFMTSRSVQQPLMLFFRLMWCIHGKQ